MTGASLLGGLLHALAQCVNLGTPGVAGCPIAGFPAPFLQCVGVPAVGNLSFAIAAPLYCPPCPGNVCGAPILVLAPCSSPPIPLPTGAGAFCSSGVPCVSFVVPTSAAFLPPQLPGIWILPIPNVPSLVGQSLCAQLFGIATGSPSCPGACIVGSHGLLVTLL